jgi:hypothetical protein
MTYSEALAAYHRQLALEASEVAPQEVRDEDLEIPF